MKHLPVYFQEKMMIDSLFNQSIGEPNKDNAARWAKRIYCDLSPENLTCDGELSRAQVVIKRKNLESALKYLEGIVGCQIKESEVY